MRRILSGVLAIALLGAPGLAFAQFVPAPVPVAAPVPLAAPIVLPHPPPVINATSSALFNAMLAISRAQQQNPQAAQTASFQYIQAVQQFRSGNIGAANATALQALATASQSAVAPNVPAAPLPLTPPRGPLAGLAGGLYGADAPAIDADAFLALARGKLANCSGENTDAAAAQQHYAQAQKDFAARDWQATRLAAKAAIDACASPQREPAK